MKADNPDPLYVEILWEDACASSGWTDDWQQSPMLVCQRGWLIHSCKSHVVITMTKPDPKNKDLLGVQTIPRKMIRDYWEIAVS